MLCQVNSWQIFSPLLGAPYLFTYCSFAGQKLLSFMRPHLFIAGPTLSTTRDILGKSFPSPISFL